jgi:glycosyltransferase involved in cell wall biosynthesis
MIRVLHVTEDHSPVNTGVTSALDALTRCVPESIKPAIVCVGADPIATRPGVALLALPTAGLAAKWRYSPGSEKELARLVAETDVVHVHGLWMWPQWAAARQAARLGKVLVVTSHGFLQPWQWQRQNWLNRLKKNVYWYGLAYPAFRQAALIHALTPREAGVLAAFFPRHPPRVIPHGIDLAAADQILAGLPPLGDAPPYFLFLGRLHPGKGIHLLIRAFARLPQTAFILKIAGPTQQREQAYADSIHRLVAELGLADRVLFTGAVSGAAKWQLYRDAWAFCLPSFSEVIGLVNLEAAAAGTPAITSYETGISADWQRSGGLLLHPDEDTIYAALGQAAAWSAAERQARGAGLRALVQQQYSWARVGQQWQEVYAELMANNPGGVCAS